MIQQDLELLGVIKHLSNSLPAMTLALIENLRDGMLPADKLREFGGIARDLADTLDKRADEIDLGAARDGSTRVIEGTITERPVSANVRCKATIEIGGADFRFSAAHTGLHGGAFEPLHGHTYVPTLRLTGQAGDDGMVMDFRSVKAAIRAVVDPLRSRTLLAGHAAGVSLVRDDGAVRMAAGEKIYVLPAVDVVVLPVSNTSTEEIAAYLLRQLVPKLHGARRVELTLSESPGTSATVVAELDAVRT